MIEKISSLLFLIAAVQGGSRTCKDSAPGKKCKQAWLGDYGEYPPYFDLAKIYCEKTCDKCGITTPEPPPSTVKPGPPLAGCGRSSVPQGRVIADVDARQGAWPWQAGLYFGDNDLGFFYGGSLVNPFWVVSAAHCFDPKNNLTELRVRLGDSHRFYNDGSEQIFGFSKITKNMVCAGQITGDLKGGCMGDSGGPLACQDKYSGRFHLQGVVSWVSSSCNLDQKKNIYSVFARVGELRKWIDDNMQ